MRDITHKMMLEAAKNLARRHGWYKIAVSYKNDSNWCETNKPAEGMPCVFSEDFPPELKAGFVCETQSVYVSSDDQRGGIHFVFRFTNDYRRGIDGFVIRVRSGQIYNASIFDNSVKGSAQKELTQTLFDLLQMTKN